MTDDRGQREQPPPPPKPYVEDSNLKLDTNGGTQPWVVCQRVGRWSSDQDSCPEYSPTTIELDVDGNTDCALCSEWSTI